MQGQQVLKFLFIINPVSGGKEKKDRQAAIKDYFKDQPHTIEFYMLTGKNDSQSVSLLINSVKPDRIVAVGGDGTVKMLAGIIMETSNTLGIIPAGSANGMAKELNIPLRIIDALKIIVEGRPAKIDVIRINDEEISIHLSDIGLNAMLVKYFEHSGIRGMWGYGRAVFRVLLRKHNMLVTIKTENEALKRRAFMVVIANASTYGTGAVINPGGNVFDGFFEVVIVRKLSVWELLKMLISRKPVDPEYIEVIRTKKVQLTTVRKAYFQIDGEYKGRVTTISASIVPRALNIMLPSIDQE